MYRATKSLLAGSGHTRKWAAPGKGGMGPILALLALAAALALMAGCASARAEFGPDNKKIEVRAGQEFTISLDSNITTGFSWQLAQPLDEKVLVLVGSEYKEPDSKLVGAGGKEVWTFKAVAKGEATITLAYARPWEKDVEPEMTETFAVTVK